MSSKISKKIIILSIISTIFISNIGYSSIIAIMDTGVDFKHIDLENKIWHNSKEIKNNQKDDDHNHYVDDIIGWNFADNNNQLIDYNLSTLYSANVKHFFKVKEKYYNKTITINELNWLKEILKDPNFNHNYETYSTYAHGTHVAGIASRDIDSAQIMAIKILSNRKAGGIVKKAIKRIHLLTDVIETNRKIIRRILLRRILKIIAVGEAKKLTKVATYLNRQKAQIANGSFGISHDQGESLVKNLLKVAFPTEIITNKMISKYVKFLFQSVLKEGKKIVKISPHTLFIFAAGNNNKNNDLFPCYPANLHHKNIIVVAATNGDQKLASFSNYGDLNVDVAAPGVNIKSTAPDDNHLNMSGTSQAAPFVTNVAGQILDQNRSLSPAKVKKIIMETVDHKNFLIGKVRSAGIVNPTRAVEAAKLSLDLKLDEAIEIANKGVGNYNFTNLNSSLAQVVRQDLLELFKDDLSNNKKLLNRLRNQFNKIINKIYKKNQK